MLSRVRTRLSQIAASPDAILRAATTLVAWPVAYAAALGSAVFVLRRPAALAALDRNALSPRDALSVLAWAGAALAVIAAALAVRVTRARSAARLLGEPPPSAVEIAAAVHRRLRPVLALPIVEALAVPAVERDRPLWTLALVALGAAVAGATAYAWDPPAGARTPRIPRAAAAIAVAALWAGYAAFFARLSIVNHRALNTRTISLGFYDNIFWSTSHGRVLGSSFMKAGYHGSAHFDPILAVFAPIYLLCPRAETLLVLQSVWLGAGVVPVYLLARERLEGRAPALALAAMYALHPALHGANLYEFHSLTLLAPAVLWLLWFLETGRARGYLVTLAAALLVREDAPLLACFVGLHALLSRRPGAARLGWITIGASLAWFVIVKRVFMTSPDIFMTGPDAYSYAFNFDEMMPNHDGARGMVVSVLTSPAFVLRTMLTEAKAQYVLSIFLPLAFLPFLARPGRVMLGWGLAFALLATRPALFGIHFHYPCLLFPVAFAIVPAAIQRVEAAAWLGAAGIDGRRLARALLVAAFVASLLSSWKLGGLVENASFHAGYLPVARSLGPEESARYAWLRAQVDAIPADARVGVSNRMGPHASNRRAAYLYPERTDVDWIVVDEADLPAGELGKHLDVVSSGAFELVARRDDLAVYRRLSP